MFGSYFPPEFSITEGNAWMSVANNSVQYVATIRPGEDVAKVGQADALCIFCRNVSV